MSYLPETSLDGATAVSTNDANATTRPAAQSPIDMKPRTFAECVASMRTWEFLNKAPESARQTAAARILFEAEEHGHDVHDRWFATILHHAVPDVHVHAGLYAVHSEDARTWKGFVFPGVCHAKETIEIEYSRHGCSPGKVYLAAYRLPGQRPTCGLLYCARNEYYIETDAGLVKGYSEREGDRLRLLGTFRDAKGREVRQENVRLIGRVVGIWTDYRNYHGRHAVFFFDRDGLRFGADLPQWKSDTYRASQDYWVSSARFDFFQRERMTEEQDRARFEAWWLTTNGDKPEDAEEIRHSLERDDSDDYADYGVYFAFEAWKASRSQGKGQAQSTAPTLIKLVAEDSPDLRLAA